MKILEIESTSITPKVLFNPDEGILVIEGRSIPENPEELYNKLILWLKEYFLSPQDHTELKFSLEYVNSGSTKFLLELMRIIKKGADQGASIRIKWHYEEEDEAIQELGEHFIEMANLPIELIPVRP